MDGASGQNGASNGYETRGRYCELQPRTTVPVHKPRVPRPRRVSCLLATTGVKLTRRGSVGNITSYAACPAGPIRPIVDIRLCPTLAAAAGVLTVVRFKHDERFVQYFYASWHGQEVYKRVQRAGRRMRQR